jgi:hypothetical protein
VCVERDFAFKKFLHLNVKVFKKIFVIVFLFTLISSSFNYIVFRVYIKTQKKEFRKSLAIENSNLLRTYQVNEHELFVSCRGFEWVDNNKEIIISGKYFDVLSIENTNGIAHITLVEDDKESNLFDRFFSSQKKNQDLLITFLKLMNTLDAPPQILCVPANFSINVPYCFKQLILGVRAGYVLEEIKPPCFV